MTNGATMPLLVTAYNNKNIEDTYVMKTFKTDWVAQNFTVAKEVLVSELANEFDLITPDYGLTRYNNSDLSEFHQEDYIPQLDKGFKFCSKYHLGYVAATALASRQKLKQYEIATLFAFDCLVLNTDRGGYLGGKPNLLISDEEMLLIDHEHTFPFINDKYILSNSDYMLFATYEYRRHIFFKTLKSYPLKEKINIFEDFLYSLSCLNLKRIEKVLADLEELDVIFSEKESFFAYLRWAKQNPLKIKEVLINRIS